MKKKQKVKEPQQQALNIPVVSGGYIEIKRINSHLGILETFTERIYIDKSIKLNRKFVPLTHEPPNSSFI